MRVLKAVAVLAIAAWTAFLTTAPRPAGACTFNRINRPCTLHCINGVSCTGTQYCIFDSCGTGIVCDGRAFNCRI